MTDGNPRPDDELIPPASTGESDEASGGDDELAPPFIPGASPESTTPPEPAAEPAAKPPAEEPPATPEAEVAPPGEAEAFPFEGGWDDEGREEGPEAQTEEDDFPFEAFDIEGGGEEVPDAAVETTPVETPPAATTATTHELADRLEDMARRLREDGVEAVETRMAASDRFTALLAGLLAGYLAGRE